MPKSITDIEVENLKHNYGNRVALAGLTFKVEAGEIFGLLGPNGGGKTTVFRILSTLLTPTAGSVKVFGIDLTTAPRLVRQRIGVVFQSQSLDIKLSVLENLRHQGHLYGLLGERLNRRIDEMLAQMGLSERAKDLVEKLSGGLRQRVELAKAFLHRPELLLLDEPTTGLDPGARRDFWNYLLALREREQVTILLTTHFMEEAERCDQLAILDQGKMVVIDSPSRLKAQIGGDIITAQTSEPEKLRDAIQAHFHIDAVVLDNSVRIERARGHEFITELVEAFPGQIDAITVNKPTLEDVFIQRTGHRFWEANDEELRATTKR
ncbi:MAG: ABC transporter ATP-binding protein [Acidobacteriota bacterium]